MKKILVLNTTLYRGGAAQVARDIVEHLGHEKDFTAYFAYGRGKKAADRQNTFYFGNALERLLHVALVRFLGLEGFGSYFATRKLINFIKRESFDLINIHNLHGYYVNFFQLMHFLNEEKIKVVWTLHDEWILTWLPAHSMQCNHCTTLRGACTNIYDYPKNYFPIFARYMLNAKKKMVSLPIITYISPAAWLQNEVKNTLPNRALLIPNGIDTALFKPSADKSALRQKYNLPSGKKLICVSCTDVHDTKKGGQFIPDLAAKLSNENCLLVVIGSEHITDLPNVVHMGYVSDKQRLAEIYGLCDAYCSLSAVETSPLSVLEAMSCGLPIIGYTIKALEELVSAQNGRLVEYSNQLALTAVIKEVCQDQLPLEQLGQASRQMITQKFDKMHSMHAYAETFRLS